MKWKTFITVLISFGTLFLNATSKENGKDGKSLFLSNCAKCHGADGTKGKWGAKNLQVSRLADEELLKVISNGRRIMPAWKKKISEEEISLVISFIKSLRK